MVTIGFPSIENGSRGSMVPVRSMQGMGCDWDGDPGSAGSATVITTSGEKVDLKVVISHVDSREYTKEGSIFGLGWAVGPNVGIGRG